MRFHRRIRSLLSKWRLQSLVFKLWVEAKCGPASAIFGSLGDWRAQQAWFCGRISNIFVVWQYCVWCSPIIRVSQNAFRAWIFLKTQGFKSDVKKAPKVDPWSKIKLKNSVLGQDRDWMLLWMPFWRIEMIFFSKNPMSKNSVFHCPKMTQKRSFFYFFNSMAKFLQKS